MKAFRIIRIDFDGDESVESVTAVASGAALTLIREVTGTEPAWEVLSESEMLVTLPAADVLDLYRDINPRTVGTDPAHEHASAIWNSLNWVYCSLINGDSE